MAHPHVLHTIWLDSKEPTNTDTLWIKPLPKGQYGAFIYSADGWKMTTALFKGTLGEFVVNDLPEATEDSNGVMSYIDKRILDSLDLEAVRLGDLVKNIFEKKVNYLKDKDGYIIFPVTHEDAVIDTQGKTLTEKLGDKQDTLKSGINIKTINNQSILGGGNITIDTSAESQISLTWSELKELQNSGELVPGCVYRITDYVATTTDVNTRSANHPFDIITKAIDECTLSEECLAALHHGDTYFANSNLAAWKIWYRLDNDTATFDWADPMNGKGVIYRMIDEFGNDIGYDFKGIQLARYRVTPAIGYENVLSSISGMWLGRNHSFTPMGLDVDISEVKWFYTFSYLANGWDSAEDASIVSNGGCYGNIIPLASLRGSSRYINNNVFLNGQFPVDTLKAIDSGAMTILNSCNFVANADCSRNTFFGGGCNTVVDSQFRDNIFFGAFRHNVVGTDVERNTIVAYHDIAANRMNMYNNVISSSRFTAIRTDQTFHDNTFNVTGEFTGCSFNGFSTDNNITCGGNIMYCIAEYFTNNNLNVSGNITNSSFGPNFKANTATITGSILNVTFSKQVNNNTFLSDLVGCNFDGIVSYVTIPAVSGKRFANCDVRGGIRGTFSSPFSLDYQGFFLSGVTGITRRVSIEGTVDGKVVATWKDNGVIKGVMKAPGGTWESIPDIDDKQDILVSGTNIKTVNNQSLLGPGNIEITSGTQSDWNQNDNTATDYIKNRTHYTNREITTNIPDAKLSWSGSTFEDIDFWFYGTNVHIPYNGHEGWELSWDDGGIFIDYLGFQFEMGILKDGEREHTPFDPSYDQQPYPLNVDIVLSSENVHKLDNKFLDLDSTPTLNSQKPVTSDGVKRAINAIPIQEQSDWNEDNVGDPAFIKNKPDDLVHYTDVGQSEPINVPDYATEEEVSQLRSEVEYVETALDMDVTSTDASIIDYTPAGVAALAAGKFWACIHSKTLPDRTQSGVLKEITLTEAPASNTNFSIKLYKKIWTGSEITGVTPVTGGEYSFTFLANTTSLDVSASNIVIDPDVIIGVNGLGKYASNGYDNYCIYDGNFYAAFEHKWVMNVDFIVSFTSIESMRLNQMEEDIDSLKDIAGLYDAIKRANIVLLGDSITWLGGDTCDGQAGHDGQGWSQYFKNILNPLSIRSYARSGASWSHTANTVYDITENTGNMSDDNVIYNQINRLIAAVNGGTQAIPDIIIIAAGTNDAWYSSLRPDAVSVSAATEFANTDSYITSQAVGTLTSIAAAMRYDIEMLKTNYPNAQIIVTTPLQATKFTLAKCFEVGTIIRECAEYLSVECIDQGKKAGIYRAQEKTAFLFTYDGAHTSELGAKMVGQFLSRMVLDLYRGKISTT